MLKTPEQREITEQEITAFEEDGIICLRGLFGPEWVTSLRQAAEASMENPGKLFAELAEQRNDAGRFFHDTFIWPGNGTCREFVFSSVAGNIAASMMRSVKVNIFFDQWLIKEPGTTTKTPWHHDMTYWPIDGDQICSVWLALDPVDEESGAVEYIKGSHRWGERFKPASFGGSGQYKEDLPVVPDIDAQREKYDVVRFALAPGDCTVHHGLIVHGAPGNSSSQRRRRAYITRWAGDDVVFQPRDGLQEMPPLPDLASGDPLDSELWPRIIG